ncbi:MULTISPECIES: hypothetical protein [Vibrio]|uniref:hypothetical protein n=1 Tax=Vibrio TaxID=662 RepID=UPI001BD51920|nr:MULTISPECIES: hypothetical protein [Vibrio]MBT0118282.1 hypothetical protein [Vibrio alginolyticus]MCG9235858.1 hypothetical protein [Vibrio harveyi]MCG9586083.1 hypothetical protein [Vibrio harveyi]NRB69758.1 hypothetical protein [Vibrio sp.]
MAEKLRGKELDEKIELELIAMLDEGYERSPITQANLAVRLIDKKIISVKSTLTARKSLIDKFAKDQINAVDGVLGDTLRSTQSMSRKELEKVNANLNDQIDKSRKMVQQNTKCIIQMVKTIRMQTKVRNIERCLSPYLIRELHKSETSTYDDE